MGALDTLRLKFHLSICRNCQHVEQQMTQMTQLMRNPVALDDIPPADTTSRK